MKRWLNMAVANAAGLVLGAAALAATGSPRTITAVTVTNLSTQALAASNGPRLYLSINNESATATIACNFGGTAVANTAGNYTIGPASTRTWGPVDRESPLNGAAINCISSAATSPATIESWP